MKVRERERNGENIIHLVLGADQMGRGECLGRQQERGMGLVGDQGRFKIFIFIFGNHG